MPKKIFMRTFGCQMNVADSERLMSLLEKHGWSETKNADEAKIIFAMGCSVRNHAEDRVLSFLSTMKPLKKKGVLLGLLGCTANIHAEKILIRHPHIDILCGSNHLGFLPEKLGKALEGEKIILTGESDDPFLTDSGSGNGITAFVPVTKGCENYCSYCIVPFARGKLESRKPAEIVSEIRGLAGRGVKSVVLLGQNVNEYGKDFKNSYDFAELLKDVAKIEGLMRIGFMTSHPKDTGEKILKTMQDEEKILKHLHLPVQSGSDKILKLMNRKYTKRDYLEILGLARKLMPEIAITSDIITGFPGETEKDFLETYEFIKDLRFDELYIFKYSPRPSTAAAKMTDDVPVKEKERRHRLLLNLQRKISREITSTYAGKILEVFVEKRKSGTENVFIGRSSNNKLVYFESVNSVPGTLEKVIIKDRKSGYLAGIATPRSL